MQDICPLSINCRRTLSGDDATNFEGDQKYIRKTFKKTLEIPLHYTAYWFMMTSHSNRDKARHVLDS